ncbi:hypothetical protein [Streptomyces sp. NPDC015131]|uniref:hypothetical protein n=1 Tax=Streptomyces sp. NPDC015131 TaxID=3364941 RepID=UPI0036F947A4
MTRQEALNQAEKALHRAAALAADTERWARHPDYPHKAEPLAAAGALWADTARAYTHYAATLPEEN